MSVLQIVGWSIIAAVFIGMFMVIAVLDGIQVALLVFKIILGILAVLAAAALGVALATGAFG